MSAVYKVFVREESPVEHMDHGDWQAFANAILMLFERCAGRNVNDPSFGRSALRKVVQERRLPYERLVVVLHCLLRDIASLGVKVSHDKSSKPRCGEVWHVGKQTAYTNAFELSRFRAEEDRARIGESSQQ